MLKLQKQYNCATTLATKYIPTQYTITIVCAKRKLLITRAPTTTNVTSSKPNLPTLTIIVKDISLCLLFHIHDDMVQVPAKFQENTSMRFRVKVQIIPCCVHFTTNKATWSPEISHQQVQKLTPPPISTRGLVSIYLFRPPPPPEFCF